MDRLLVSLVGAFNLASFLIQVSYIAIGLFGIGLRFARAKPKAKRSLPAKDTEILV